METKVKSIAREEKIDTVSTTCNRNSSSVKNETLWLLNVIRGFSAILIVLYHYTTQYNISIGHLKPYPVMIPWGCHAVYTFFILSGFLTMYSSYHKRDASKTFLVKRVIRLYPIFWICVLVTTLYMMLIMPERVRTLQQIILNFTMVPALFRSEAVDGVYWTLSKELMFYVIYALAIKWGNIFKSKAWLWLWLAIGILGSFYCCGSIDFPAQSLVSFLFIPEYAFSFLAGCGIFYFYHEENNVQRIKMIIFVLICIGYCAVLKTTEVTIFFIIMILLVGACANKHINEKLDFLKNVFLPILFVSEISYPLYLTHQFIGFGIIRILESSDFVNEIYLCIPIIHSIVLASILHFFVEIPIGKKCNSFFLKKH